MKLGTLILASTLAAFLSACATPPQTPISLAKDYYETRTTRIGVAMSPIPQPDTVFPGAGCLLCLATASIANSAMTAAVKTWPTDDLKSIKLNVVSALTARGQNAVMIDQDIDLSTLPDRGTPTPGFARKDFSGYGAKTDVDRVLVVNLRSLGAWRNYSAYVPTGAPRAVLQGEVFIVDISSNKLDLFEPIDISRFADGSWDEPPKFPGLANAYFQVLEEAKETIQKSVKQ